MNDESELILEDIVQQKFITEGYDCLDIIPLQSKNLFALIQDWKSQMPFQSPIFETVNGINTGFQFIGWSYKHPSVNSEQIISNFEIYKYILNRPIVLNDNQLRESLVKKAIQHLSCVFNCPSFVPKDLPSNNPLEIPESRLLIIKNITGNISELIRYVHNNNIGVKTWKFMFNVIIGIIHFVISNNFFSDIQTYASVPNWVEHLSAYTRSLISHIILIQVHYPEVNINYFKEKWESWSRNKVFIRIWCELFSKYSIKAIDQYIDPASSPTDNKQFMPILILLLNFEVAIKFDETLEYYSKCLREVTEKINEVCTTFPFVYVPKFPVYIICNFLILKSIFILEQKLHLQILKSTIWLVSLSGFDQTLMPLRSFFIKRLNSICLKYLQTDSITVSEMQNFFVSNEFQLYFYMSSEVLSIVPHISDSYQFNEDNHTVPFSLFSFAINLSSLKSFHYPSKVLKSYCLKNTKNDESTQMELSLLWGISTFGRQLNSTIFNDIVFNLDLDNITILISLLLLLTTIPYISPLNITSFITNQLIEKLTNRNLLERLHEDEFLYLQIALIEISSSGGLISTPNIWTNLYSIPMNQDLTNILLQIRFPRIRSTLPTLPECKPTSHFIYHNRVYTIYELVQQPMECILYIRDIYGCSILHLTELLTNHLEMPKLVEYKETKEPEEPDEIFDISVDKVDFEIKSQVTPCDLTRINEITLPPFYPIKPHRPLIFEVIRSLNLMNDSKNIKILDNNKDLIKEIMKLDECLPISEIIIPVYYVDQRTKSFNEVVNDRNMGIVCNFLSLFCQKTDEGKFVCTLNSIRLVFAPNAREEIDTNCSVALYINYSGFYLSKKINELPFATIISLSAIKDDLFRIIIEKKNDKCKFALGNNIMVAKSQLRGYLIYVIMNQLLTQGEELFVKGTKERLAKIEAIEKTFGNRSPQNYLCNC